MLCYEDPWKEKIVDGVSIKELQKALRTGKDMEREMVRGGLVNKLAVLEERLMRVRSWGGSYSAIEFSPDIKILLKSRGGKRRSESIMS